jgi:hypothetical protein
MTHELIQVQRYLARIRALTPAGQDVQDYLRGVLNTWIASISSDTPMGIVPPSVLSATRVYASARIAVELIHDPMRLAEKPEGIIDLGTIEWLLRPALLLRDGMLDPLTAGPWQKLAPEIVRTPAKSVCRIDLAVDGAKPFHIGTGFVVADDDKDRYAVMTNAHVVDEAMRLGWLSTDGLSLMCDFERYEETAGGELFPTLREYKIHSTYDLALLYLSREQLEQANTQPLVIAAQPPDPIEGFTIGVIGHPSFDSRVDPFPKYFGFGNEFGIKRFSPGYIRLLEDRHWRHYEVSVFTHDATTLSGSSGSCVLDLSTTRVLGLHFGGWPFPERLIEFSGKHMLAQLFSANGAVPLWLLYGDSFLSKSVFAQ